MAMTEEQKKEFWKPKMSQFNFKSMWQGEERDEIGYIVLIPQAFGIQLSVAFFGENTYTLVITGEHKANYQFMKAKCDSPVKVGMFEFTDANFHEQFLAQFSEQMRESLSEALIKLLGRKL